MNRPESGVAADVPFLAVPPDGGARPGAPLVVAWHLMDSPRSEAAFAAALPLAGLDAWKIYLGLPFTGARLPAGGPDELMGWAMEDAVLRMHGPLATQAASEFPAALAALRSRFDIGSGPLGVMGGSIGAAVAQLVVTEGAEQVDAAVLVSPVVQLRAMVEAMSAFFGMTYTWTPPSNEMAARMDFVERAADFRRHGPTAVLSVVGEDDDVDGFRLPAQAQRDALAATGPAESVLVPGMGHALADEPGIEPAPQTPHAAQVDRLAVDWFGAHLRH